MRSAREVTYNIAWFLEYRVSMAMSVDSRTPMDGAGMTVLKYIRHPTTLLAASFTVIALLLLAAVGLSISQVSEEAWVRRTLEVQNTLTELIATLQDAETGHRAYVITGEPRYLAAYRSAAGRVPVLADKTAQLTLDNPDEHAAISRLRPLLLQRLDSLAVGARLRQETSRQAAYEYILYGRGEALMYTVRQQIRSMRAQEALLLGRRQAAARTTRRALQLSLILGFLALVALMVMSVRQSSRQLARVRKSRDDLAQINAQLIAEGEARERAEGQLRQMQKMDAIGHLTGGIAHDFNNMLAVVIGSLELARRRMGTEPERARKAVDNALEGAQRAAGLTARLLAFSRRQALAPTPLDPNKLVSGMSELLRRTIGEHLNVETVLAGGVWRTSIDAQQLESAILNLAVNARDAMPDGGNLTIETSNAYLDEDYARGHNEVTAGQYVLVSVTDTGDGMPPEVIERAFDPFYTTKGVGHGTGLGLSQVHGFVKQSGGHITIYSEVGHGTSVKIYLPRWMGEAALVELGAAVPASAPRARDHEIILLVEDDDQVRNVTADMLRELDYVVVPASSGDDALQQCQLQSRIDLLLTDVVMPGMTGQVLAEQVHLQRPELKVLYMTGYTRNAVVHNGVLDPGVAFLQKPFTADQLAAKIRQVLDGEGANRPILV